MTDTIHAANDQPDGSYIPGPLPTGFDGPIGPSMSTFSADYMTHIENHLDEDYTHVPERLLAVLRSTDELVQGFQVTQLVHGLQTATMAERAGADLDMIVASLFHDVGKMISNANHPAIAAEMIRPWVSDEAYWVVKVHQDFEGMHYYARMGLDPMVRRKYASEAVEQAVVTGVTAHGDDFVISVANDPENSADWSTTTSSSTADDPR